MTLTARDRRIVMILAPLALILVYWFLILSPKRHDLSTARAAQHQAEQARDAAVAQADQLEHARATFAADYADLVRLGKAIPASVDAPSLLVQLSSASRGTHVDLSSVAFGQRTTGGVTVSTTAATPQPPAAPGGNAAAGGAPAGTGPGGAVESAGNTVNQGNQASSNVNAASGGATTTTTTTTTGTTTAAGTTSSGAGSLDTVSVTFIFTGTYFDLADFFHRLKRYVLATNNHVYVRGRLMTVDSVAFARGGGTGTTTNALTANVSATIYLSPAAQGVTGGASAAGPAGTTTTPTTTTPSGSQTSEVPLAAATR